MEKESFKIFDIENIPNNVIPNNVIPNLKWLIPLILDDKIIIDDFIQINEKPIL